MFNKLEGEFLIKKTVHRMILITFITVVALLIPLTKTVANADGMSDNYTGGTENILENDESYEQTL